MAEAGGAAAGKLLAHCGAADGDGCAGKGAETSSVTPLGVAGEQG